MSTLSAFRAEWQWQREVSRMVPEARRAAINVRRMQQQATRDLLNRLEVALDNAVAEIAEHASQIEAEIEARERTIAELTTRVRRLA